MAKKIGSFLLVILCILSFVSVLRDNDPFSSPSNFWASVEEEYLYYNDFFDAMDIPNTPLIIEELLLAEEYEDIYLLQKICDDAGYYNSALFGQYVGNSLDKTIHKTNSSCFSAISPEALVILSPAPSLKFLEKELNDKDDYLKNYSFCSCCDY